MVAYPPQTGIECVAVMNSRGFVENARFFKDVMKVCFDLKDDLSSILTSFWQKNFVLCMFNDTGACQHGNNTRPEKVSNI